MLCPFGQVLRGDDAENVAALKPRPLPGIQLCAVTGRAAAVGVCAGAAGTQLELAGGVAVFPAQHLRADHHDFAPDVLLVTDLFTVLGGDGRIGDALNFRAVQGDTGLFRLFRHTLPQTALPVPGSHR